jgi:GNAT superfamily N-acetyltransferase
MKTITDLEIHFVLHAELTPELQQEFDALDHLAFGGIIFEEDPDFPPIQWSTPDWMALGFMQGRLVTQLCIPTRQIMVGSEKVRVAGIGGMATHPEFQHRGLGSVLLAATETFMRDTIQVPFGLLICADELCHFYELSRWQFAAHELSFTQDGQRRMMNPYVMVLQLTARAWPAGEIDLCGLPW